MEFVNLTPFGAAAFQGIDAKDNGYDVVVMRVVYRLVPAWQLTGATNGAVAQPPDLSTSVQLMPLVMDQEPPDLVTADRYSGEFGSSSVLAESDLAPFKPRCDVLVTGRSHAPYGRPARTWLAGLRVSQPSRHLEATGSLRDTLPLPLEGRGTFTQRLDFQEELRIAEDGFARSPGPAGERSRRLLLNKALRVHGPRSFVRGAFGGWRLQAAEPAVAVPLGYEQSYGGHSRVDNPKEPGRPLLDEVCYSNPLGSGWVHARLDAACKSAKVKLPQALRAPQLEWPAEPVLAIDSCDQPTGLDATGMRAQANCYAHRPAGFGPLGRAWTPRIQQAGVYDEQWLEQRWPNLPRSFDMGYWNAAPADQQIEFPQPDAYVELVNLVEPWLVPSGHAWITLPGHRASVLFKLRSGLLLGGPCVIDTLHVDTDAMTLAVVWRASVLHEMQPVAAELRFALDLTEPLFKSPRGQSPDMSDADVAGAPEPTHG